MFEHRAKLSAFHGFIVALCLAALAGCGGDADATSPNAVPANLAATAGNAVVTLTWTASDGATGYNVQRATASGGPYTQIAAPTSTSYLDSAVTNGTTYYYVVQAVSSSGTSANSTQVTAMPSGASGSSSVGGLHVSGNKLLNGNGQQVSLRGVNYPDTVYACTGYKGAAPAVSFGPLDGTSVTALQSWGVNALRLSINETCWLGINGVPIGGSAYVNPLVAYINLLTSANIAVIIELQWNMPGTGIATLQQPMPDADHATAFWTSVANTLKSNSAVIFDLFGEPFPDSNQDSTAAWVCLLNGGTCPGVSYTTVGMQALVSAVRATGATNVIMIPGIQYTNQMDQWLSYKPTDSYTVNGSPQIAADMHFYPAGHDVCTDVGCWSGVPLSVANSVPFIAGEIGEFDCADGFINPLMTWLDGNTGGNYLAWGWYPANCSTNPALISNFAPGDPTAFGAGFKAHLLSF